MDHLHPKQAFETLQANPNTLLIDCRTEVEFYYVGHPIDAINIEWNTAPDFDVDPNFAEEAQRMAGRKLVGADQPMIEQHLLRREQPSLIVGSSQVAVRWQLFPCKTLHVDGPAVDEAH